MPCGHTEWKAHVDLALGCVVSGAGFGDLRKQRAWEEIRTCPSNTFAKCKVFCGEAFLSLAQESMKSARVEEAKMAAEAGSFLTLDGKALPRSGPLFLSTHHFEDLLLFHQERDDGHQWIRCLLCSLDAQANPSVQQDLARSLKSRSR